MEKFIYIYTLQATNFLGCIYPPLIIPERDDGNILNLKRVTVFFTYTGSPLRPFMIISFVFVFPVDHQRSFGPWPLLPMHIASLRKNPLDCM